MCERNKGTMIAWMLASCSLSWPVMAVGIDCRDCHAGSDPKAKNYLGMYANPEAHHPVEVSYPPMSKQSSYRIPTGRAGENSFFDNNGNGIPDANEIQIFNGRLECASCHDPAHGTSTPSVAAQGNPLYLRRSNRGSEICVICHRL